MSKRERERATDNKQMGEFENERQGEQEKTEERRQKTGGKIKQKIVREGGV